MARQGMLLVYTGEGKGKQLLHLVWHYAQLAAA